MNEHAPKTNTFSPYDGLQPAPRFNARVLGRLQETVSVVQCECPNHLAGIVLSLLEFERYAAACENRNAADAQIHQMLHAETTRARLIMEEALTRLCVFESISTEDEVPSADPQADAVNSSRSNA